MNSAASPVSPRRALRKQPIERPPTLVAIVTERVRKSIVDGEFRLGEYISEDRVATSLDVSRTPVREAMTALQLQGLVNIQPQRGTFVFLPTADEAAAMCEFRMIVECRAMALCLARNKERALERLKACNQEMADAVARGDALASGHADSAFHNVLFDFCGNKYLAEAYSLLSPQIDALRNHLSRTVSRNRPTAFGEHQEIIDAFGASDLSRAESLLSMHIFKMRGHYAEALETKVLP
jgi:DNA-binding GntR family transcriptional regulator